MSDRYKNKRIQQISILAICRILNSYSIFPFILYLKLSLPSAIFLASSGLLVVMKSTPESTHF